MDQKEFSEARRSIGRVGLLGFLAFLIIFPGSIYFVFIARIVPFILTAMFGEVLFFLTFYLENKLVKKYQIQWRMKDILKFFLIVLLFAITGSAIALVAKSLYGVNLKTLGTIFPLLGGAWAFSRYKKSSLGSKSNPLQLYFSYQMSWLLGGYILVTLLFLLFLIRFPAQGF